ncbi:hypothetical protein H113_02036 [Trichophyton rubrum MR1459]|nr:hypothetical protein H113_02036 [Trichophyton rubrum MR1459]
MEHMDATSMIPIHLKAPNFSDAPCGAGASKHFFLQTGASEQLGVINGLKAVENPKRRENSRDDGDDATNDDYFLNFDELVRWAFGPQGFPSLQMIGVGDLSDEVKPCENALLCRKSNPECEEVFPGRNYRFVT